jgi:anti-anti-sigma factor
MLNATAQKLGDCTVLWCQGRIVIGDAYAILRNAVLEQTHTRTLILDLAQVDRIDAGGLGVLLDLREWAHSRAIRFQLMNVINLVKYVLQLTKLDRVLEFCSAEEMLQHLDSAAAIAPPSVDQANQRIMKDNCKYSVEKQNARPAALRNSLLAGSTAREHGLAGVPADVQSAQIGTRITNEESASIQQCDSSR